jgi:hypothetical protein
MQVTKRTTLIKLVKNENTSPDVLRKLADTSDTKILYWIALNDNTPSDVLDRLSHSRDANVLMGVAINKNTTDDVLKRLFNHFELAIFFLAGVALQARGIDLNATLEQESLYEII